MNARTESLEYVASSRAETGYQCYATLSHRWESDEVTFQDVQSGSFRDKRGYIKIRRTCKQAIEHDIPYVWVDTCCIDKKSSAEVAEAVNSMWQWYYDAKLCYVYLYDVPRLCPELRDTDNHTDRPWYNQFARSEWWSRGWTLQELLASRDAMFYGEDWGFLGRKSKLHRTISRITGIDLGALEDRETLGEYMIARKLSWAAGRKTTRLEDRAYSLLGLFGISLPLMYGEGNGAFVRLQEELVRTTTDHSVFAWGPYQDGEKANMLFAVSPDQFRCGSKMVQCFRGGRDNPFHLTNRGVSFDSVLVTENDNTMLFILNCMYEDDLRGPLGLRICQKDESTSHIKEGYAVLPDEYWIVPDSDRARLTVYDDMPKHYIRKVKLLRDHPAKVAAYVKPRVASPPKIWLRTRARIVDAYPAGQWNLKTGVLCPASDDASPPFTGSAWLVLDDAYFSLAFSCGLWPDKTHASGLRLVLVSDPQPRAREILFNREPAMADMIAIGSLQIRASVKVEHLWDDLVYVIVVSEENDDDAKALASPATQIPLHVIVNGPELPNIDTTSAVQLQL